MGRSTNIDTSDRERGFGLVEAIVAGFVVLLIGVAITTLLANTTRTQAVTTLGERRLAAAEGLFDRLKADSSWSRTDANSAGCGKMDPVDADRKVACSQAWMSAKYAPDGLVDQSGTDRPITYETRFRVEGIDDVIDGVNAVGANPDRDGRRPDYYRATIGIRRAGSTDKWTEISGTIDPPGRVGTGAIVINVCQVQRQYDERIPIAGCVDRHDVLLGYPAGGVLAAMYGTSTDRHAQADWNAALDRANPAAGPMGWAMVTYPVQPASGVTVELRRADGGPVRVPGFVVPSGCTSPTTTVIRCITNPAVPLRRINGLTPGHYKVNMVGFPHGYDVWPLHSIPSSDTAIVEARRTSRVLQVIKPVDRDTYTVSLRSCDHSEVMSWGSGPCVNNIQPSGVSGYLAPASSARAHWTHSGPVFGTGEASVGAGASSITFGNLAPGLYSGRIVTPGQGSLPLTHGAAGGTLKFMWIEPVAHGLGWGHGPPSGVPTYTRHWCDHARRVAYLAGVGLPSSGGTIPHTHNTYDAYGNVTGTYVHNHVYYSADASCPHGSSGGGGPPGPGGGGA